jgi:hypothetical protein
MDMREASAMTGASGRLNDPDGRAPASGGNSRPLHSPSRQTAVRLSEQLRGMTVKAPLQSRFVAFLLGVWVARRR